MKKSNDFLKVEANVIKTTSQINELIVVPFVSKFALIVRHFSRDFAEDENGSLFRNLVLLCFFLCLSLVGLLFTVGMQHVCECVRVCVELLRSSTCS